MLLQVSRDVLMKTQVRIAILIREWVANNFDDFSRDKHLLEELFAFVDSKLPVDHRDFSAPLRSLIEERLAVQVRWNA
jgi:hypothetical protein